MPVRILLGLCCAFLFANTLSAQTVASPNHPGREVVHQAYETQLPGEWPKGWRRLWGDSSKAVLGVSNMRAVQGSQSLLFHRTDTKQYGIACMLPVENGVAGAELSFCFCVVGAGNDACFSFEMRQGKGQSKAFGHIRFADRRVALLRNDRAHTATRTLGKYTEGKWHKIVITFPADGSRQLEAELFAGDGQEDNGQWQSIGEGAVETTPSTDQPLYLTLTAAPNKTAYELYIDQLQWRYPAATPTRKAP